MGMFDSVMVPCPRCGTRHEFQSKSGECTLAEFLLENAPDDVLEGIDDVRLHTCTRCGASFRVVLGTEPPEPPRRKIYPRVVEANASEEEET
jgi:hypothetical protein